MRRLYALSGRHYNDGAIYPALARATADGLLEAHNGDPRPTGGRRVVYYKLTDHGRAVADMARRLILRIFGNRNRIFEVLDELRNGEKNAKDARD